LQAAQSNVLADDAWKSRDETIASERVVAVPVRDENRDKRPACARDHIAECVDVFPDQQRVHEKRVASICFTLPKYSYSCRRPNLS
jgi:hypothetical protein